MHNRRHFLVTSSLAFLGLQKLLANPSPSPASKFGELIPDPKRILDLPKGFSYRILSKSGDTMSDGFKVPGYPDGMGAFDAPDGKIVLVRNHELDIAAQHLSPFTSPGLPKNIDPSLCYDPGPDNNSTCIGGTTNIVFDPATGEKVSEFLSLIGTDRNCAGGIMPWGSWITCEESDNLTDERGKNHGWCFEVKASTQIGLQKPIPIKALGRFCHEAVALDPASGILYLTEDRRDGLLYRFIPDTKNDFSSGKLQALAIANKPRFDLRNYTRDTSRISQGETLEATWIDLNDTHSPEDNLRFQGHQAGAALFARGEGIHFSDTGFFIACTDGGPDRYGQIFRLIPADSPGKTDTLELFIQSHKNAPLINGDNLCPTPTGGLVVCEDLIDPTFANHTHLRWIDPDGTISTFARNPKDNTEFAGTCFSADGKWLFINLFGPGLTLAITGPWS